MWNQTFKFRFDLRLEIFKFPILDLQIEDIIIGYWNVEIMGLESGILGNGSGIG